MPVDRHQWRRISHVDGAGADLAGAPHLSLLRGVVTSRQPLLSSPITESSLVRFFFQAEDGIRDWSVTGVQTCALPIFSYGHNSYDPKAGWVRKELDLTNDLDALYQKLFALSTHGGTEYVTRVCRDAAEQLDRKSVV